MKFGRFIGRMTITLENQSSLTPLIVSGTTVFKFVPDKFVRCQKKQNQRQICRNIFEARSDPDWGEIQGCISF